MKKTLEILTAVRENHYRALASVMVEWANRDFCGMQELLVDHNERIIEIILDNGEVIDCVY